MKSQENPHKGARQKPFVQQQNNFFSETDPKEQNHIVENDNISYES